MAVAATLTLLGSVVPAATAQAGWTSQFVPISTSLGPNATFTAESCPAVGQCVAVGDIPNQDPNPNNPLLTQPLAAVLSSGSWSAAALTTPPSPPPTGAWSTLTLTGVSCVSIGVCTAVGNGTITNAPAGTTDQYGIAEVLSGGTWTVTALTPPPGATIVSMTGVSCTAATSCVAVGSGTVSKKSAIFAYSLVGAPPWTAPQVLTNIAPTYRTASLNAVSCVSSSDCVAVGSYFGTVALQHPLVEQLSGATWTSNSTLPVPTTAVSATLTGVSCAATTSCQAVGSFTASTGPPQALVETLSGNAHWEAVEPSTGEPGSNLAGVSCSGVAACAAVGTYLDSNDQVHALIESMDATGWTPTTGIDPPNGTGAGLTAVSCPQGACVAVGDATTAGGIAPFASVEALPDTTQFVVTAPATATAGSPVTFTVLALTAGGNPATDYSGTVMFTSTDPFATLPAPATLTNGSGTFTATFGTSGSQTITATDSVFTYILGTSGVVTVAAAPPKPAAGAPTMSGGRLFAGLPDGSGYWLTSATGGVFSYGRAQFYGSLAAIHLNQPVVGMASTPDGAGYWLVAADGGIFSFGDAGFHGSLGAIHLNQPIVDMTSTPAGRGYWLVAADGGVFSFGDAGFHGSLGAIHLNQPVVGMASTPDGGGYWLVASDGGIFSFGDAQFHSSLGNIVLNEPIVGMASTSDGGGYWLAGSDGSVFALGDAGFYGSEGSRLILWPVLGIMANPKGNGYSLVDMSGAAAGFS